jgi:hypothetical protein
MNVSKPTGYDELTDELMEVAHGLLRIIGGREPEQNVARAVRAHALLLRLHSIAFPVDGANGWSTQEYEAVRNACEEARAALRPFSQMKLAQPEADDVIALLGIRGGSSITNGDILRARAVLAPIKAVSRNVMS